MKLAPIVLFVYNRPWHTEQTLNALMQNELADQSVLYIYCDGVKEFCSLEDNRRVEQVRDVVRKKKWCKEVQIIYRNSNLGLADNIVRGVTEVINKHGRIIVLEDDIVTSPGFLKFMNDALTFYENEEKVMHISGYMFPIKEKLPQTFFYNATSCWGWATWKNNWKKFNSNASELYTELLERNDLQRFDLDGNFGFLKQLKDNKEGNLKTWAIKWHTSVFLNDGLCLHPNTSFVDNIGHDGTGENCGESESFKARELAKNIDVNKIELIESKKARRAMNNFNSPKMKVPIFKSMKRRLVKFVPKKIRSKLKDVLLEDGHKGLYKKYNDFTMIPENIFYGNLALCKKIENVEGSIVECGVWRGGMSGAMAEIIGKNRDYYLFDSFEGLPDAKAIDGKAALDWQSDTKGPIYFDNCAAEIKYAEESMRLSKATNYNIIKGWFSETLPDFQISNGIALLRLDGDWYDSTMDCLVNLYPKVNKGGMIIIDDYYVWDGCTRATHDYLSKNNLPVRIRQSKVGVCYIIKE